MPYSYPCQTMNLKEDDMMKNLKKSVISFVLATIVLVLPQLLQAHCQIPCGIYDDFARVQSMREDAATVEKSIRLIMELAGKTDAQSQNQLVRWVMNKEVHAQKIITSISDYFLTQRVKPDQQEYAQRLKKHHFVILAAMKAKQNADIKFAKRLKESIEALADYYPEHKK
jgi:nickel superoxide dismutase